jgi:hypothetical protein
MSDNKTQKQIAELKEKFGELHIFSDDSSVRAEAISALPKGIQENARKLAERSVNAGRLLEILMADLRRSSEELRKNYEDQFWRRIAIRAMAAAVDGIIFSLKEMAHSSAELNGLQLSDDDNKFLLERKAKLRKGGKPKFFSFKDNFKQTFKLYAKLPGFPCPTDFSQDGFAALCDTYDLRHRLMHPKSFMTFCVTTEETRRAGKAVDWLDAEVQKLIGAHNQKLISNVETILNKQSSEV